MLSKIKTALAIWIVHYLSYYWVFGIIFYSISYWHKEWKINWDFFKSILISPLLGIFGLYDGLIAIIPFLVYLICRIKFSLFKSYLVTLFICYVIYFIYLLGTSHRGAYIFTRNSDDNVFEVNALFLICPALLVSILIHYFILKKRKMSVLPTI